MLLTGGVFTIKYLRAKVATEKSYFRFATDLSFSLGFIAFFAQPFIGWGYAKIIQGNAQVAFHAIMGGHVNYYFIAKMIFIGIFCLRDDLMITPRTHSSCIVKSAREGLEQVSFVQVVRLSKK